MNPLKKAYCRVFQNVFKFALPLLPYRNPKIIGSVKGIPEVLEKRNYNNVLIITDAGIRSLGLTERLEQTLKRSCISYHIYDKTVANPTTVNVDEALHMYLDNDCQAIIGFGGGSSMDCAKATAARIAKPHQSLAQMKGILKIHKKLPLLIAIPTTAGTGSEVTCVSVLSDHANGKKAPIVSEGFYPAAAIIDPELTYTMPPQVTAGTGIDVLSHAIEGYWSKGHQPICDVLAMHAAELVFKYVYRAYRKPDDDEAREKMCEASLIAGLAFTLPKTTSSHACSFPLTNIYHIPHGEACGLTLDYFIRINAKGEGGERVEEFARRIGFKDAEEMADAVLELKKKMGLRCDLKDLELDDDQIAELVRISRHPNLYNNPVEITDEMLDEMYRYLAGK